MSNPNRLTPRAQEMFARVGKYLASGLSQKAFCAQEAIAFTTLQCVIAFPHGVIIRLSGPVDFAPQGGAQLIHATTV